MGQLCTWDMYLTITPKAVQNKIIFYIFTPETMCFSLVKRITNRIQLIPNDQSKLDKEAILFRARDSLTTDPEKTYSPPLTTSTQLT